MTFNPVALDRETVWPRLDVAKMVFSAALKNILPNAVSLPAEVDGFCFKAHFLFDGPLPPLFLTLLIEEMRRLKKASLPLKKMEMMRSNAALFLKHHGLQEKGEALDEAEDEVAPFIRLNDDIEEVFNPNTLETTFDLGVVQLLSLKETGDGMYEVVGTAFEEEKEAKNFAKLFRDQKEDLGDWIDAKWAQEKRDRLFALARKKWESLGFKELIPFFQPDTEEVEQEAFERGNSLFFLPDHDVGFVFGSEKELTFWKKEIDGWLKEAESPLFEMIETKWGVQWSFIDPIGSRFPGPFIEIGRKAKFSSPKKEVVCHPIHVSLVGQLKSWLLF